MGSQCKGITKSGTQCKMTGVFPNGYCRLHQSQCTVEIEQDTEKSDTVAADETMSCGDDNPPIDQKESIQSNDRTCRCFITRGTIVCTFLIFAALFLFSKKLINKK